jgi:hypothetical protein
MNSYSHGQRPFISTPGREGQTDRQTDRGTDRHTDRLTDTQADRETDWLTDRQTHRLKKFVNLFKSSIIYSIFQSIQKMSFIYQTSLSLSSSFSSLSLSYLYDLQPSSILSNLILKSFIYAIYSIYRHLILYDNKSSTLWYRYRQFGKLLFTQVACMTHTTLFLIIYNNNNI